MPTDNTLKRLPLSHLDKALTRAFAGVLAEGLPDRFVLLLEDLARKGPDHDVDPTDSTRNRP